MNFTHTIHYVLRATGQQFSFSKTVPERAPFDPLYVERLIVANGHLMCDVRDWEEDIKAVETVILTP